VTHDLLFPGPQTGDATKRATESTYDFLNRVTRPEVAAPRPVLEEWFAHWPADDRNDLRGRLQAKDGVQFAGAFWELYLHEVYRRLGFECQREPEMPDSEKRPDFLMWSAQTSFYLEATVVDYASKEAAERKRQEVVLDMIEAADHPDFALRIHQLTPGDSQPSRREVVGAVEHWLGTLDWQTEIDRLGELGRADEVIALGSGWRLRALPYPRPESSRGDRSFPTIATRSGGGMVNEPPTILDDLRDKASKYGRPDRPYVIAALCAREFATELDIEQALYGPEVVKFPVGPDGPVPEAARIDRQPKGLWQRGSQQSARRVSALLSAIQLHPWSIVTVPLTLWLNPWASYPLTAGLPWATVTADLAANQFVRALAEREPRELLDLPKGWPYSTGG
jgi:hypothetical protein